MASGFRARGGSSGGGGGLLAGDVTGPLLANVIAPNVVTGGAGGMLQQNTVNQGNLASDAEPFTNMLTNPGFNIEQLYDPTGAAAIADNAVSADAWKLTYEAAGATYQRMSNAGSATFNSANRGRYTKTGAAGKLMVYQALESLISLGVNNDQLVFTIKFNLSAAHNMRIGFIIYTGATPNEVVPPPVAAWNGPGVAPTLNAGFAYVGSFATGSGVGQSAWDVVFTMPTLGANDKIIVFAVSDTQFAPGDFVDIYETSCDVGAGGRFTWRPLSETEDIDRCRRFIQKSYDIDTVSGTVTTNGRLNQSIAALLVGFSSGDVKYTPKVRVPLAAEITLYSPSTGAAGNWFDGGAALDYAVAPSAEGENGFSVIGGAVVGNAAQGHFLVNTSL
jgi:hypothetical protein